MKDFACEIQQLIYTYLQVQVLFNGPYSLLVHASNFILCSVHTQFPSVLPIN